MVFINDKQALMTPERLRASAEVVFEKLKGRLLG